jgi:signal transduction histidine kinase
MTRPNPGAGSSPTSFWRFSLRQEWIAGAAAAALILTAGALSLEAVRSRYLELQRIEANRVEHHLHAHLDEALEQLEAFLQRPSSHWRQEVAALLPAFSDLYEIGDQDEVLLVFKAAPGSRVFPGFSFTGTPIGPYLPADGRDQPHGTTPVFRGLEDEKPSLYVHRHAQGRGLLARIQLSYIQRFLQRYSAFSGTPTLLVSRDGFVMLSGTEGFPISSLDLRTDAARRGHPDPMWAGERLWRPVISDGDQLGVKIVTLLPEDHLAPFQQGLVGAGGAVLLLSALVFHWKNRRLRRELFTPVGRFAEQIEAQEERVRQGLPPLAIAAPSAASSRFTELAALQGSFDRLIETLVARDRALGEARQREQLQEERQRRELRDKLHSSLMAATIAHEINLPLSMIRLLCHQASEQIRRGDPPPDVEALVSALSEQSQQVSGVIEKMRMLLRNVQSEPHPTDPVAVLQGACLAVKPLLRRDRVRLEVRGLEPAPALLLQGDAVPLQMAVSNLLRNGIEAACERPPGQRRVRLGLEREPGGLVVEVADSGPGFRFDPDADTDTVLQTDKPGGSGLGLFVVRTTVANHRGRLSFGRCGELGGARVRVHLPLEAPP